MEDGEKEKEPEASEAVKDEAGQEPAVAGEASTASPSAVHIPTARPSSQERLQETTSVPEQLSEPSKDNAASAGSDHAASKVAEPGSPKSEKKGTKPGSPKAEKKGSKPGSPKAEKKGSKPGSPKAEKNGSKPGTPKSGKTVPPISPAPKSAKKSTGGETPRSAASGSQRKMSSKAGSISSQKTTAKAGARKGKKPKSATDGKVESLLGLADQALPEGVVPIFLAVKTQELFSLRTDEDVTTDSPYKFIKKEDILKDLQNRAAVCDFHPIRQTMIDYPGEEILIVYDPEFKHGQNFVIATTEEAKQVLLREAEEEEMEEEEEVMQVYVPPPSKDWVSFGSEKEVNEESIVEQSRNISVLVVRPRREFGAPTNFTDRNATDIKDGYVECPPFEDKAFDIQKMLQDRGIQSVPETEANSTQTDFKRPRNAAAQTEPREYSEEERNEVANSDDLAEFIKAVAPRVEETLQQNEIMNVFYDDWMSLTAEDGSFGSKADNHLKEFQSFTDLQFSKARTITCIDWHPTIKGVVAVSVGERMSFDDRVDSMHKTILTPSLILIWSFTDPIHPQILLEAPDDILCFKFCPTDPNFVAGGCISGQVVLWDISEHSNRLRQARAGKSKDPLNALAGFEDDSALNTPIVRYCAVSSIEHSHRFPITDLLWVPDHFEVNRMGVPQENKSGQCCQIMTCATDHPSTTPDCYMVHMKQEAFRRKRRVATGGMQTVRSGNASTRLDMVFAHMAKGGGLDEEDYLTDDEQLDVMPGVVLFWDIRASKTAMQAAASEDKRGPGGIATTFKHLDLVWKPHLKVTLTKSDPGGDHAPTKFSITERQGDRSILAVDDEDKPAEVKATDTAAGAFAFGSVRSGGSQAKKTLTNLNTFFYIGTEDGELVYVDWMPQKDQESGKIQTPKPEYYHSIHDGPIVTLQRSPFFKDVILCVGGWTFSIWRESVATSPILRSSASTKRLTGGHWSPSRPAVFYITKQDGSVDIWDLLDRTHEPCMNQNVSSAPITCIYPFQVTGKQHLLAVGDAIGTLHILAIPWSLRQPTANELTGMANYIDREVKRRAFVMARWDFREREKMDLDLEAKRKAGIAPQINLTDDEIDYRMRMEYQAYLEEETAFLRHLGILDELSTPGKIPIEAN